MRYALLIILVLFSGALAAAVYKWVDPQGNVHYSDIPDNPNAEQLDLPEYSRYRPRLPELPPTDSRTSVDQDQGAAGSAELVVVQPEKDQTIRDEEGKVSVVLLLNPSLADGQYIKLMLDGTPVEGEHTSTSILLVGVLRGPHVLQARLMDESGAVLRNSDSVRFYMRQLTRAEREGSAALRKGRLYDDQKTRLDLIEQERKAQEEKALKDQRAQEKKVEDLRRQGDYRRQTRDSSLYRDSYSGESPNEQRFSSGTDFKPSSSENQRNQLKPRPISGELDTKRNPAPLSGPIPSLPNNPNFAPNFAPPAPN